MEMFANPWSFIGSQDPSNVRDVRRASVFCRPDSVPTGSQRVDAADCVTENPCGDDQTCAARREEGHFV
jgi:hypothetical protein